MTRPLAETKIRTSGHSPELPPQVKALDVHQRALAEKISIVPGPIFSAKQGFQNFIRINIGNPWTDRIEKAVPTLGGGVTALNNPAAEAKKSERN